MPEILSWLPIIVTLIIGVAGYAIIRGGQTRTVSEVQERVINALKGENESLARRVQTCMEEVAKLRRTLDTIRFVLRQRGLRVEVDGQYLTLIDEQAKATHVVPLDPQAQAQP